MRYLIPKIFFIFVFSFLPLGAHASELRLDTSKVDVRVGEEFVIEVRMNAEEAVNAVEGMIVFSGDSVEIQEIRDGNSSINFWIERPHVESSGSIVFSGVTPGGFSGVNNSLFSVVFLAKREGVFPISITSAHALLNDGLGTEEALSLRNAVVDIKTGDSGSRIESIEDNESPEPFVPYITSEESMFDGKYFVVFATQDKGSGIERYEVREGKFGWWKEAESPYALSYQRLDKDIYVRAIDHAGNEQVSVVPATVHSLWWERYGIFAILIVLAVLLVISYKKAWVRFIK